MAYSSSGGAGAGDPSAFTALEVQIQRTRSGVSRLFDQSDFIRISLIGNEAGVRTVLDTLVYAADDWAGVFDASGKILFSDKYDGATASTNYIEVSQNGLVLGQLCPVNSDLPNSSGLDYGGNPTRRVGLVFNGNSDATAKACRAKGGRIVDPPAQGTQAPGVGRPDFIAFGENAVYSGVLGEDTLLTAYTQGSHDVGNLETGQVGLYGRYVSALTKVVSFTNEAATVVTRRRVLATDGREADIHCAVLLDPIDHRVYEWDITKGGAATDLLGFRVCCNHGPGVMIAAPDTNRGLLALCAKSDKAGPVYSWQNFNPSDAGITTTTDRAWVSSVPDEIVALVEIPGDAAQAGGSPYETLLMCSRSIYSVRGDPRIDGGQSTVSTSTGIFGPEAYCFDNRGNLWWVGNGGLHAMPKGTRTYTKTDGSRMPEWFELADVDRRQLILRYRASDNTILVYLTPRVGGVDDGQSSRVAVYDIEAQQFTRDEYPPDMGPTAAAEITGQKPQDRDVVMGGVDGRIYRYDDQAYSDNGAAIDFLLDPRPNEEAGGTQVAVLDLLDADAAVGTGPVEVSIWTGQSPVEVQDFAAGEYVDGVLTDADTPHLFFTLWENQSGGKQRANPRCAGAAHRFMLRQFSATETVAIERLRGRFTPAGEARF